MARAKAHRLDDRSLPRRRLPYRAEGRCGPMPAAEMRQQVRKVAVDLDFHVTLDHVFRPDMASRWEAPEIGGVVIGERAITVDHGRSVQAALQGLPSLALGLLVFVSSFLLFPDIGGWAGIVLLAGVGLLAFALVRLPAIDSFDSEVLVLRYRADPPSETPARTLAEASFVPFRLDASAGYIASSNQRGSPTPGRGFRAVLPDGGRLTAIPHQAVARLAHDPPPGT
jgi:hypothetical protein